MTGIVNPYRYATGTGPAPFGTHTYWKFISRNVSVAASFTTMTGLHPTDGAGNTLSTTGVTLTGSTTQAGSLSNLVDGDDSNTSFWQTSTTHDAQVKFQFASPAGVGGCKIAPLSTAVDRAPIFFDWYYSDDDSSYTYAFSGVYEGWSGNTLVTFLDPGDGAQTDWIIAATALNGSTAFFMAEGELHTSIGGSDIASGGTALGSPNVAASGFALSNMWDNNTADSSIAGASTFRVYDYLGYRLSSAADLAEVVLTYRAAFPSQALTAGTIIAGANRGFRRRKDFSGLTWASSTETITI